MDSGYLDGIGLFKKLQLEERDAICQVSHSFLEYHEGDLIIKEGETGGALFVLLKGSATVTKGLVGQATVLATLNQGDTFGEMSFLTRQLRSTNVVAREDVLVLKMDESLFESLDKAISNKIKDQVIDLLAQRLDKMNQTMAMLARYVPART